MLSKAALLHLRLLLQRCKHCPRRLLDGLPLPCRQDSRCSHIMELALARLHRGEPAGAQLQQGGEGTVAAQAFWRLGHADRAIFTFAAMLGNFFCMVSASMCCCRSHAGGASRRRPSLAALPSPPQGTVSSQAFRVAYLPAPANRAFPALRAARLAAHVEARRVAAWRSAILLRQVGRGREGGGAPLAAADG